MADQAVSQLELMLVLMASILGLCVGSFLNVVIHRLPIMMAMDCSEASHIAEPFNLAQPGSHCPACRRPVRWYENIPLLGYLWLKGCCAGCGCKISLRYPLVEAGTAALSGLAAWHFGATPATAYALIFIWISVALAGIDFDTLLLPDSLTQPLLWLGLIANLNGSFARLDQAVIGVLAGYLLLWSIAKGFRLFTGKEGMGSGDFKLLAALGAWFGWPALPGLLLGASLTGIGLALMRRKNSGQTALIPFGPTLVAAGIATLYLGRVL